MSKESLFFLLLALIVGTVVVICLAVAHQGPPKNCKNGSGNPYICLR